MEKTAKCTEKHSEDIKRVSSDITGMKTARQQITQNITTNADLITKLQDRIDQVEKNTKMQTVEKDVANQSTALVNGNDNQALTQTQTNIQNIVKKHNEIVEYLKSQNRSHAFILKLLLDLKQCNSFHESVK